MSFVFLLVTKEFYFLNRSRQEGRVRLMSFESRNPSTLIMSLYLKHKLCEESDSDTFFCITHIWPDKHNKTLRKVVDIFT